MKRQIERDLTLLSAEQLIKTKNETPIILDIVLENGQLTPQISPLRFCEHKGNQLLPALPEEHSTGRFFGKLLRQIQEVENQIAKLETRKERQDHLAGEEASADWQFFDFKEKVAKLKEAIQLKHLGYKEHLKVMSPVIPYRLKRIFLDPDQTSRARKEALRDKFFQSEALQEIREEYRHRSAQFDSTQTDLIVSYLDVRFIESMLGGFLSEKTDRLTFTFASAVTHSGDEEIEWLMEKYRALFDRMEIPFVTNEDDKTISVEGHSLMKIFAAESGVHLFYLSHRVPVPVKVMVRQEGQKKAEEKLEVIRIYDGMETLTDIRTGYSNTMNFTPDEFKLLIYGGMASGNQ